MPQVSQPLSLNSHEIMLKSMLNPYTQSSFKNPLPLSTSTSYTLQQKLQATKQKLKQNNNKHKTETKRSLGCKEDKAETHQSAIGRPNKYSNNKSIEPKTGRIQKPYKIKSTKLHNDNLELNKSLNISLNKFNESIPILDLPIEINKIPNHSFNTFSQHTSLAQKPKSNKISSDKSKVSPIKQAMATLTTSTGLAISKVKPTMTTKTTSPRNPKSVYIDLDCAAEQARLKSTILQNKTPEKKSTVPITLNPAMLLSSCPGLSITPIIKTTENNINRPAKELSTSRPIKNNSVQSKIYNFEQLQQLSNSFTITKTEKNDNKKPAPAVILLD